MPKPSPHLKGFLITFAGVMALTPDALLIRLADLGVWQMAFWRNGLMSVTLFLALGLIYRNRLPAMIRQTGKTGVLVAAAMAVSSVTFVLAFEHASAAKVLITISIIPMISAILSVIFLREAIRPATLVACLFSMIGIAIVVSDSFFEAGAASEILGIGYALITAVSVASTFVLIRSKPTVSMVPAPAMGCLVLAVLLWFVTPGLELRETQVLPVLAIGLFVLPVSFGLLAIGPRYIPAPEVGLLMLLETCLGPFWVWLVLHEQPSATVLIGGTITVTTLAIHALWCLRRG